MDPLLATNNLGRSVSKANFARIRKALAHGSSTLSAIMSQVCCHALISFGRCLPPWHAFGGSLK